MCSTLRTRMLILTIPSEIGAFEGLDPPVVVDFPLAFLGKGGVYDQRCPMWLQMSTHRGHCCRCHSLLHDDTPERPSVVQPTTITQLHPMQAFQLLWNGNKSVTVGVAARHHSHSQAGGILTTSCEAIISSMSVDDWLKGGEPLSMENGPATRLRYLQKAKWSNGPLIRLCSILCCDPSGTACLEQRPILSWACSWHGRGAHARRGLLIKKLV
mmetsp:Transcript_46818/g.111387  ORF Transcript_46818/g.111387 Transcript_46818/m.111387 type:complete len:213 (+) Transcript_46818:570-1208(+)